MEEFERALRDVSNLSAVNEILRKANEDMCRHRGGDDIHAFDPQGRRRPMGEILVEAGVITREQLEDALAQQDRSRDCHLGEVLVAQAYAGEDAIAQTLASQLKLPCVRLADEPISPEAIARVDGETARRHLCIPLRLAEDRLVVAMSDPQDLIALEAVELASKRHIDPVIATPSMIRCAIEKHYPA
jgi:type IV pilus assembly protein PilB